MFNSKFREFRRTAELVGRDKRKGARENTQKIEDEC